MKFSMKITSEINNFNAIHTYIDNYFRSDYKLLQHAIYTNDQIRKDTFIRDMVY